ncbi:MAG: type VI secretion system baseplate subunit TssG [Janthinobacterium lividum]
MPPSTTSVHQLLARLRRQPFDLRLEVILAELLAHGYAFDDFLVRPVGLFARRYRRDLGAVYDEPFERGHRPVVRTVLEMHREGLYDALPQQAFHQPGSPGDGGPSVRAMVEDSRLQRRKEKATRLFFLPFEQDFFRFRVRIEQEERRYFTNLSARWYNEALARFWGISDCGLPPGPLTNLLYLLPLAYNVVGDLPRTQLCFESVLGQPVKLRTAAPRHYPIPEPTAGPVAGGGLGRLGRLVLGTDLVLGGEYRETLPSLEITLQGLNVPRLETYLADEWPAKALALLCEYFVAFETDVIVRYEMAAVVPEFRLGEGAEAPVLGFTTAGI